MPLSVEIQCVRDLLPYLQGVPITYRFEKHNATLEGFIRDGGYMCLCSSCDYRDQVLSAVQFEKHAGATSKHQNNHVFLNNGTSLYELFHMLREVPAESFSDELRKAITADADGSLAQGQHNQHLSLPAYQPASNGLSTLQIVDMPVEVPTAPQASNESHWPQIVEMLSEEEPGMHHLDLRANISSIESVTMDDIEEPDAEETTNAASEQPRNHGLSMTTPVKGMASTRKFHPESVLKDVRGLLATGLLEGFKVTYKNNEVEMVGFIEGQGYCCGCSDCDYNNVLNASEFEKHSGKSSNNQNDHIFLDSGISLYRTMQALKGTSLYLIGNAIEEKIHLPPNMKQFEKWKASFQVEEDDSDDVAYDPCSIPRTNFKSTEFDTMEGIEGPAVEEMVNAADQYSMPALEDIKNAAGEQLRNNCLPITTPVNGLGTGEELNPESVIKDVRGLLTTGLLEGLRVTYKKNGVQMTGVIHQQGYCCCCQACNSSNVLNAYEFEKHFGESSSNPNDHILLDNGISLYSVVEALKGTSIYMLGDLIEKKIGLAPNLKQFEEWRVDNDESDAVAYDPCSIQSSQESAVGETSYPVQGTNLTDSIRKSAGASISEGSLYLNWYSSAKKTQSYRGFSQGTTNSTLTLSRSLQKGICSLPTGTSVKGSTENTSSEYSVGPLNNDSEKLNSPGPATVMPTASVPDHKANPAFATLVPLTVIQEPYVGHSIHSKSKDLSQLKMRNNSLHQLIFKEGGLPDGTLLIYRLKGKSLMEGYKRGTCIVCTCCNKEFSPSHFEDHAGHGRRRQPYQNIYTQEGLTLHKLSMQLQRGLKVNGTCGADTTTIDEHPKPTHSGSGGEPSITTEPVSVPLRRSLQERVVKTESCYLCGSGHTTVGTISLDMIVFCNQCERPCHVKCYKKGIKSKKGPMKILEEYTQFSFMCCEKCQLLRASLYRRLQKHEENISLGENECTNGGGANICWQLLSAMDTRSDSHQFIPQVIDILKGAFAVTAAQGNDIIPSMVNAKDLNGEKDFRGMYCAMLTKSTLVVSAAILKVRTEEVAELVLIATRSHCRKEGYCRLLLGQIEAQLKAWKVQLLMAPVDPEMESIWSEKFGFTILSEDRRKSLLEAHPLVMFENLSLAQKSLA